ncbi:NEGR1 regulator, partial [Polypterus senegalus]
MNPVAKQGRECRDWSDGRSYIGRQPTTWEVLGWGTAASHGDRAAGYGRIYVLPPKICEISPNVVVNEGSNVTLFCQAKGKPEPSISWRHITPSDPPIILEMKLTGMGLGRPGLIRCETAAVPSPLFEWYKGEKNARNMAALRWVRRKRCASEAGSGNDENLGSGWDVSGGGTMHSVQGPEVSLGGFCFWGSAEERKEALVQPVNSWSGITALLVKLIDCVTRDKLLV